VARRITRGAGPQHKNSACGSTQSSCSTQEKASPFLARTELAREQADVLAFVNKNRGGCDALRYDLADFIDAVAVSTSARMRLRLRVWPFSRPGGSSTIS